MRFALHMRWHALLALAVSNVVTCQDVPKKRHGWADVHISAPSNMQGHYLGMFGTFSGSSGLGVTAMTWTPFVDPHGCKPYFTDLSKVPEHVIAVVRRGNCTFVQKALQAQRSGADGVIIVSDTEEIVVMSGGGNSSSELLEESQIKIFAASVQKVLGDKISAWNAGKPLDQSVRITFTRYIPPTESFWDASLAIELLLATGLVIAGAFFATADLRHGSPLAPKPGEEVLEISAAHALSYCAFGSIMLMTLFFLMKYLIYFIMLSFCFGGAACIQQMVSACLQYSFPRLRRTLCVICEESLTIADAIALAPALFLAAGWAWWRNTEYGFIFQNILGAGFLCMIQRTLRLPNLKVAAILLSAMFFFDIFWVFLSPWFFRGKSVMVEVAKGGGTNEAVPMLLRIPSVDKSKGGERMLGFGDIALPGLLISYLLRFDMLEKKTFRAGYFVPGVIGYAVGLLSTIYALMLTHKGQPALLYLVPATLIPSLGLGWSRGDLFKLWNGSPNEPAVVCVEDEQEAQAEVVGAIVDPTAKTFFRSKHLHIEV